MTRRPVRNPDPAPRAVTLRGWLRAQHPADIVRIALMTLTVAVLLVAILRHI